MESPRDPLGKRGYRDVPRLRHPPRPAPQGRRIRGPDQPGGHAGRQAPTGIVGFSVDNTGFRSGGDGDRERLACPSGSACWPGAPWAGPAWTGPARAAGPAPRPAAARPAPTGRSPHAPRPPRRHGAEQAQRRRAQTAWSRPSHAVRGGGGGWHARYDKRMDGFTGAAVKRIQTAQRSSNRGKTNRRNRPASTGETGRPAGRLRAKPRAAQRVGRRCGP